MLYWESQKKWKANITLISSISAAVFTSAGTSDISRFRESKERPGGQAEEAKSIVEMLQINFKKLCTYNLNIQNPE